MARRSYGSGRLWSVKRKKGEVWYASWWAGPVRVKRKLGPKRGPGSSDGLTRAEAERELRRRVERDVVVAKPKRRTLEQAGEEYIDHLETVMERKRTTIQDYRGYLRGHFAPYFGDRQIEKIDPDWVAAYLRRKLEQGYASKTIQNHLNFLHGIFAFAVRRGWVSSNPVALVDRPKKNRSPRRRIRFLQPSELDRLVVAVPDDEFGKVERPLYLGAAMTGLRQGELLALRWVDIDWVAGRIRIAESLSRRELDTPKSHEGRSVPMADRLAHELERHFQRSAYQADNDLVFCHPHTGRTLEPSTVTKRFKRALKGVGLRELTFHELRHTFGTQMAAVGTPLRAIQEWMGHADAKTTEVYRHYAPDPTNGAALVARAFGNGLPNGRGEASGSAGISPEDQSTPVGPHHPSSPLPPSS
ncbi:MAG: tyrosine-type recombinase/integrase [Gemmatimonas sp.]|nr:tyrosine-type recombinase/integrase [Gemmatimonas sp.]